MAPIASFVDSVSRFLFEEKAIRGTLVSLDSACEDIVTQHPYPAVLRRALAELLAASVLLAAALKFKGALIVQLQGAGPVRLLVVECDARLNLRATAQWTQAAEALPASASLSELAGDPARSRLAIMLDPQDGSPIYQGIVALEASSIATLIEHYLSTSEQIDSRMVLATEGTRVRGLLLQRLPRAGADEDDTWRRAAASIDLVDAAALLGAPSVEALLTTHFHNDDVRVFAPHTARFHCDCTKERVKNALRMLGRDEIEGILAEQGEVGVTCEFCNRAYTFDPDEARGLFRQDNATDALPNTVRH
jgi:molecular chaperone Hsp33